jgi:hypothetical protein
MYVREYGKSFTIVKVFFSAFLHAYLLADLAGISYPHPWGLSEHFSSSSFVAMLSLEDLL